MLVNVDPAPRDTLTILERAVRTLGVRFIHGVLPYLFVGVSLRRMV